MNYRLMTERLKAVSKEMRSHVWHLAIMDQVFEKMDRDFERMIWSGSTSAADEYRTNTRI